MVMNLPAVWETWVGKIPGGGHGNPLQYSCLENPHGQRSLVGYSPWGRKELEMTERLNTAQRSSQPQVLFLFLHRLFFFQSSLRFTANWAELPRFPTDSLPPAPGVPPLLSTPHSRVYSCHNWWNYTDTSLCLKVRGLTLRFTRALSWWRTFCSFGKMSNDR